VLIGRFGGRIWWVLGRRRMEMSSIGGIGKLMDGFVVFPFGITETGIIKSKGGGSGH